MHGDISIVGSLFLIFTGAAALATVALYTRQPLLVAYIALGALLGPFGFALVADARLLSEIAEFGIVFLLFLVGLDLPPRKLRNMIGETMLTALGTTAVFFAAGYGVMSLFGFTTMEAVITGVAAAFSSTILGIKLLPTTVLHHRHVGEIVISLLLIQDLLAIFALIMLNSSGGSMDETLSSLGQSLVALPVLMAVALAGVRWVVLPLLVRFDAFREFIFLLTLGWCLGLASLAALMGLSHAIGAFVAGVSLATSPISQYIAESLRPLRDFFLVLFFFSVGAGIDPAILVQVLLPTLLLGVVLIAVKPLTFGYLLKWQGEETRASWEVGFRLGQLSEFSLLLSYTAMTAGLVGKQAAHVIEGATIVTLLLSSYLVIFRYPSPIAVSDRLRRD
ncbi:MAG: cation:proton antiporter [Pseudomonadales bacterium]|nr:cation:proton antiporter [Pseudomonadales bacterium]MCP5185158.1 cation:proton antiporter [Pseudomonadales bacterium]